MDTFYPPDRVAELLALRPYVKEVIIRGRYATMCSAADVEDAVQLVYIKALGHLHAFRPEEGGMKAWLARIACNVMVDALRSKVRHDEVISSNPTDMARETVCEFTPERVASVQAFAIKVADAINQMPPKLREVLRYVDSHEIDHEHIATELRITTGAAKMRLSRARAYLRDKLGPTEEHYGVVAPVPTFATEIRPSFPRKTIIFLGQVVHLLPPLVIGMLGFAPPAMSDTDEIRAKANDESIVFHRQIQVASTVVPDAPMQPKRAPGPPKRERRTQAPSMNVALDGALNSLHADGRIMTNGQQ
jgi:RNA polymerase sigma-70 factor, ECF subfamily